MRFDSLRKNVYGHWFFFNIGEVKNTGALPVGTTELQFRVDDQCSGTTETLTIVVTNIVSLQL